jgi:hypothetical protein
LAVDVLGRKTGQYARSIGDPAEAETAEEYFEKRFDRIKEIFIQKAAETNFPRVSMQGFNSLLIQLGFVKDAAQTSEWQRLFKAAESNIDTTNKKQNLNRAQFFEVIMRIAGERYHKSETGSISDALRMFSKDNLKKLVQKHCSWKSFRE